MDNNKFARIHKISINLNYSVTPHHSGVWPIYNELYKMWSNFSIKATSTESYPASYPTSKRRGFIYNGLMVLPRYPSGVFTTNHLFDQLIYTKNHWKSLTEGGNLFEMILYNQVNIFMTHFGNYGNDRIAMYLFENVFAFSSCWTNLKYYALPPLEIANKYFELHPLEMEPVWFVCKTHFCK